MSQKLPAGINASMLRMMGELTADPRARSAEDQASSLSRLITISPQTGLLGILGRLYYQLAFPHLGGGNLSLELPWSGNYICDRGEIDFIPFA